VGEGQLSEPEIARGRERAAKHVCPSVAVGSLARYRRRHREHADWMPRSERESGRAGEVKRRSLAGGRRSVIFAFRFQFDFLSIVGCYHFG